MVDLRKEENSLIYVQFLWSQKHRGWKRNIGIWIFTFFSPRNMNIGVGVAREYEYSVFRREYWIPVYWKHFFFIFFFHFCNFVFSVQYAVFTRLIHLFLHASAQRHSARSLFCRSLTWKPNFLPLSLTKKQERYKVQCFNQQNFDKHVSTCHKGAPSGNVKSKFLTMIAQEQWEKPAQEEQGWH